MRLGIWVIVLTVISCHTPGHQDNAVSKENVKAINVVNDRTIQNKEIVAEAFTDWVNGTGDFFRLLDERVAWRVVGQAPYSRLYQGKRDFLENAVIPINNFLATPLKPELIDVHASDDIVWLHWRGTAKAHTGQDYNNEYAWKLELDRQGKIIAVEAFLDTYSLSELVNSE